MRIGSLYFSKMLDTNGRNSKLVVEVSSNDELMETMSQFDFMLEQ